jgi:signal transduction histidine kinase
MLAPTPPAARQAPVAAAQGPVDAQAPAAARAPAAAQAPDSSSIAEAERRRWARELHDDALGALEALHMLLWRALRAQDAQAAQAATGEALCVVEQELTNLRSIAAELDCAGGEHGAVHDDLYRGAKRR